MVADRPPLDDAGRAQGAGALKLLAGGVGGAPVAAQHVRRLGCTPLPHGSAHLNDGGSLLALLPADGGHGRLARVVAFFYLLDP